VALHLLAEAQGGVSLEVWPGGEHIGLIAIWGRAGRSGRAITGKALGSGCRKSVEGNN
jgi:hypothetical protein